MSSFEFRAQHMTAFDPGILNSRSKKSSKRFLAYGFYIAGVAVALLAAAVLSFAHG